MTERTGEDYGQRAVEEPATRALRYGQDATDAGVRVAVGGPAAKAAKNAPAPPQPVAGNELRVNPASMWDALTFKSALTSGNLPPALEKKVRHKKKGNVITFPTAVPAHVDQAHPWIADTLAIGKDWEVTTGILRVTFDPNGQKYLGSQVVADIQGSGSNHNFQNAGRSQDEYGVVSSDPDHVLVIPLRFHTTNFRDVEVLGLTIPSTALLPPVPKEERALLITGRGLIVVVREVQVGWSPGRGNWSFVEPGISVPKKLAGNVLAHELAAHAGRISARKEAKHPNKTVDKVVDAVDDLFPKAKKPRQDLVLDIAQQISQLENRK